VDVVVEEVRLEDEEGSALVDEGEAEVVVVSRGEEVVVDIHQGDVEAREGDSPQGGEGRLMRLRKCRVKDDGYVGFCKFHGVYGILWHVLLCHQGGYSRVPNKRIYKSINVTGARFSSFVK
jgi:hypothetical protein